MSNYIYILRSTKTGQFYIGQTSNLEIRLEYHNGNRVKSTKNRGPWKFLYTLEVDSLKSALSREKKLKNLKSRKRILKWISAHLNEKSSVGPEFYQIYDLE